jgi:hypothetical protein
LTACTHHRTTIRSAELIEDTVEKIHIVVEIECFHSIPICELAMDRGAHGIVERLVL